MALVLMLFVRRLLLLELFVSFFFVFCFLDPCYVKQLFVSSQVLAIILLGNGGKEKGLEVK